MYNFCARFGILKLFYSFVICTSIMNTYWFSFWRIFSTSALCVGQYSSTSLQAGQFRYFVKSIISSGFLRFVLIPVFFSFSMISNPLSCNSCYLRLAFASVWTCSHSNTHVTAWTIQESLFEVVITSFTVTTTCLVDSWFWSLFMIDTCIFTECHLVVPPSDIGPLDHPFISASTISYIW